MTQEIEVPGVGILEFPDNMSDKEMSAAIYRNFPQLRQQAQSAALPQQSGQQQQLPQVVQGTPSGIGGRGLEIPDVYGTSTSQPVARSTPGQLPGQGAGQPKFDPIAQMLAEHQAKMGNEPFVNSMKGIGTGVMDKFHGAAQSLAHALPDSVVNAMNSGAQKINEIPVIGPAAKAIGIRPQSVRELDQQIVDREAAYKAQREAMMPIDPRTGNRLSPPPDVPRFLGNALPILAMGGSGAAAGIIPRIAAGTATGAAWGAAEPVTSGVYADEKKNQLLWSGGLGGGIPAAGWLGKKGWEKLKDIGAPFTKAGKDRIISNVLKKAAGDSADDALANLKNAKELVPGSAPTAGQVAGNAGIAALERTAIQTEPVAMNQMAQRLAQQNDARIKILDDMAGTPTQKALLKEEIEKQAGQLYAKALEERLPVTDDLVKIFKRPSMQSSVKRAQKLAAEESRPYYTTLDELTPKHIDLPNEEKSVISYFKENPPKYWGAGWHEPVPPTEITHEFPPLVKSYRVEIPHVADVPVRDMHTLKMAMDAQLQDKTLGMAGQERNAVRATRNQLLNMLPEDYQKARQAYIELNKPVNQMDIADLIKQKSIRELTGKIKPEQFVRAFSDDTAKQAVGLKNATLKSILSEEQLAALKGIQDDLSRANFAETAGRGVGSDTVQKLAYSNILAKGGWLAGLVNGPTGKVINLAYKGANDEIHQKLAQALLDPKEAARLMEGVPQKEKAKMWAKAISYLANSPVIPAQTYPALYGHELNSQ